MATGRSSINSVLNLSLIALLAFATVQPSFAATSGDSSAGDKPSQSWGSWIKPALGVAGVFASIGSFGKALWHNRQVSIFKAKKAFVPDVSKFLESEDSDELYSQIGDGTTNFNFEQNKKGMSNAWQQEFRDAIRDENFNKQRFLSCGAIWTRECHDLIKRDNTGLFTGFLKSKVLEISSGGNGELEKEVEIFAVNKAHKMVMEVNGKTWRLSSAGYHTVLNRDFITESNAATIQESIQQHKTRAAVWGAGGLASLIAVGGVWKAMQPMNVWERTQPLASSPKAVLGSKKN